MRPSVLSRSWISRMRGIWSGCSMYLGYENRERLAEAAQLDKKWTDYGFSPPFWNPPTYTCAPIHRHSKSHYLPLTVAIVILLYLLNQKWVAKKSNGQRRVLGGKYTAYKSSNIKMHLIQNYHLFKIHVFSYNVRNKERVRDDWKVNDLWCQTNRKFISCPPFLSPTKERRMFGN